MSQAWPERANHKDPYSLKDLSKAVLGLSIQEGPHSALHDALATMALWLYHELPCNKGEWTRINKVCRAYYKDLELKGENVRSNPQYFNGIEQQLIC